VFLQLPGKKSLGPSGWAIQAKLDVYFWFGLAKNRRDFLKGLPLGYQVVRASTSALSPPTYLTYAGKIDFCSQMYLFVSPKVTQFFNVSVYSQ